MQKHIERQAQTKQTQNFDECQLHIKGAILDAAKGRYGNKPIKNATFIEDFKQIIYRGKH